MLTPSLGPALADLVAREKQALADLRMLLADQDAVRDELHTLEKSIERLDRLFLLVVVGEFNAGKSAFINALLGLTLLEEGVTPTTARVTLVHHPELPESAGADDRLNLVSARLETLRQLTIVDTPGTNAIIREHELLTQQFVPRADLVLFVTSADRPFTETERQFLEQIRDWGKKVVLVINKVDIFQDEADIVRVVDYVRDHAGRLLGGTPPVFPVSARLAMRGKGGDGVAVTASRFGALERYIHETLDEGERVRLKLLNPLGIGQRLVDRHAASMRERLEVLREDVKAVSEVQAHLEATEREMHEGCRLRLVEIEQALVTMEQRGHAYFDEMLRLGRMLDLLNRTRVQRGFEEQVVADTPRRVEQYTHELVDWMVDADFKRWQQVTSRLAERRRQHAREFEDDETMTAFQTERRQLVEAVARAAQRVVEGYDKRREAEALADGARNAVAAAATAGVGALGLGALVTIAATTAAADVTGLVMASAAAVFGLLVVPTKRRNAKRELREKLGHLRETLSRTLREQFERELARGTERIRESMAPYTRFVERERNRLTGAVEDLARLGDRLGALRAEIEAVETSTIGR